MATDSSEVAKAKGKPMSVGVIRTITAVHKFLRGLTGGRILNTLGGDEVCFVAMTGAKSGRELNIPLMYVPYNDGVLLVASQGGNPNNPSWYYNLVKHPEITVEHRGKHMKLTARLASAEEKVALWPICDSHYAPFADYRTYTDRDIPMFVCEPS